MLRDRTIEKRVKARMQSKIESAQARYEEEKRRIRNVAENEKVEAYQEYVEKLETIEQREGDSLEKLEEECVGEACAL